MGVVDIPEMEMKSDEVQLRLEYVGFCGSDLSTYLGKNPMVKMPVVPGHEVDVRRQKIIQTIPTNDKSKDNLVAVRAADGYEKGDKVLRTERIKIFKYEASRETPPEN